jgi:hypothetical protein
VLVVEGHVRVRVAARVALGGDEGEDLRDINGLLAKAEGIRLTSGPIPVAVLAYVFQQESVSARP